MLTLPSYMQFLRVLEEGILVPLKNSLSDLVRFDGDAAGCFDGRDRDMIAFDNAAAEVVDDVTGAG